jgi:peptide deformylase
MAILEIKKYPDPILRKKCQEVKEMTEEIRDLFQDMIQTMTKNQGIGLAAPQIGILKRIIVVQTENATQAFINPKIIKESKEIDLGEEGCLSFPGLFLKIKRAKEVEVKALDIKGNEIRIKAEGLVARIFQHEIDHLDGILFIDRISFWQRLKIKKSSFSI